MLSKSRGNDVGTYAQVLNEKTQQVNKKQEQQQ